MNTRTWLPVVAVVGLLTGCGAARDPKGFADDTDESITLACPTVTFAASLLDAPGGAERDSDPAARALAEFLAKQGGVEPVFKTGYRVVSRTSDRVTYISGSGLDLNFVAMEREGDRWDYSSSGACQPEIVYEGFEVARWTPDVQPQGTELALTYDTGTCYPESDSYEDRFDHAEIRETDDAVIVTILLRPEATAADGICAGVGLGFQRTVTLPKPLGGRRLLDGTTYPPRVPGEWE